MKIYSLVSPVLRRRIFQVCAHRSRGAIVSIVRCIEGRLASQMDDLNATFFIRMILATKLDVRLGGGPEGHLQTMGQEHLDAER